MRAFLGSLVLAMTLAAPARAGTYAPGVQPAVAAALSPTLLAVSILRGGQEDAAYSFDLAGLPHDHSPAADLALPRLGSPPKPAGILLVDRLPRFASFDLNFYSDVPPGGYDAMYTAEVVVSLTHRF